MANQTVPELNPIVTIKNTDLIEVTVDNGGGSYTSYRMAYGEFKKFGSGLTPETITFVAAGSQTHTPAQNEVVAFVVVFDGATIEIAKTASSEVLLPSSDAKFATIGYLADAALAADRRITITADKECEIILMTIKGLI
jgi:hypothetical protein